MILLTPQKLLTDGIVLSSFEVVRSAKSIDYRVCEFNNAELRRRFFSQATSVKDVLQVFTKTGIEALKSRLTAIHAEKYSGLPYAQYFHPAFLREIHGCIATLMPFLEKAQCFHKIKNGPAGVRTAPCKFINTRPVIQFELQKKAGRFIARAIIRLGDLTIPAEELSRTHFLLRNDNHYHLLGYKDYQTLEWLNSKQVAEAGRDETEFRKSVLSKLEGSYKVDRNNLLESHNISSPPENQVMVNELNDNFLMLTPQWLYEGFLLEGNFKEKSEILKHGAAYVIWRDRQAEDGLREVLVNLHPVFKKQSQGFFFLSFAEASKKNWFLKAYHQLLEQGIRIIGMDLLKHFRFSEHRAATEVDISEGDHEHELRLVMRVAFGSESIPLLTIQKILLSGQHTVFLSDDSLGILDETWQQKYGDIFRHGRVKNNEIYIERWMAVTAQYESPDSQLLKPVLTDDWWGLWLRWQANDAIVVEVPPMIHAGQLRPYQQRGFEWMVLLARIGAGACLADDMGLGKTLQTICFLAHQLEQFPGAKHLVACPASLVYNWQQEFAKFAPGLRIHVYHGTARQFNELEKQEHDIVITSLGTLRSDIELLENLPFCVAVVDESHIIKNPYALITGAVNRIGARTRVALSGTPVINNTFDLYAQLNFVLPGMFGSREFFKRTYADPIDRNHDPAKIKMLQKLTAPFILRRTKAQAAPDLPEKTEIVLWCDMGMLQRDQYILELGKIRSSIFLDIAKDGFERSKLSIIQGIMRLRQVCNSPLLLPNEDFLCKDSVKTEVLIDELANNLKGHKVLVFSQFSKMLLLIAKQLEEKQLDFYLLDGKTAPKRRMEMVNCFQEEGNTTNIFLISLMAGNTGLNLTAADYVFLFDPWWNTAVQQQAIDRTHRIGQTKNVFAYKMICRDTIEEKIVQLQERKKYISDSLISGEDGFVKNLTIQDLEFLLN